MRRALSRLALLALLAILAMPPAAARAGTAPPFGPAPAPPFGPAPAPPSSRATAASPSPAAPAPTLFPAPPPARAAPSAADPWSAITAYGAAGLALAGGALWFARRRRLPSIPAPAIDVIAQRSLSARSKIVWLAAGDRELLIAVTPQQLRVLASWRREHTAPAPAAAASHLAEVIALGELTADRRAQVPAPAAAPPAPAPVAPSSPAVAGIIRLRARTQPPPPPDDGDDPTDIAWAKELLAATDRPRRATASEDDPR